MERLTSKYWRNLDPWEMCGQDNYCKRGCHDQGGCTKGCIVPRIYDRLAVYEDTGLEPEEIERIVDAYGRGHTLRTESAERLEIVREIKTDRLRELVQAEQDGRLVVLPCKAGDKVRVDARTWGNTWNYKTVDVGKYLLGEIVAIIKTRKQTLIKIRVEHNVSWKRPMRRYPISAIGKTVFLTREEAEAALKGGEG